jgi:hypothetical protein
VQNQEQIYVKELFSKKSYLLKFFDSENKQNKEISNKLSEERILKNHLNILARKMK